MYAVYFMMKAMLPDDEELRKRRRLGNAGSIAAQRLAINIAYRLHQDLNLFASPSIVNQVIGNPAPAWDVVGDGVKALNSWTKFSTDGDYTLPQALLQSSRVLPGARLINSVRSYTKSDFSSIVR